MNYWTPHEMVAIFLSGGCFAAFLDMIGVWGWLLTKLQKREDRCR